MVTQPEPLTDRQADILRRAYYGETQAEIAAALGISIDTVSNTLRVVRGKLGLSGYNWIGKARQAIDACDRSR